MECKDFLEGYSAYRDGLVDEAQREAFRTHAERCDSCARYDRVVRKGTDVLRDLPQVDPPSDFLARLQHRIYHIEDGIPLSSAFEGGSAAVLAVAAVGLLALAWMPFAVQAPVEVELPAVAVDAPERPPVRTATASSDARELVDPGPFVGSESEVEEAARSMPVWSDVRLVPVSAGGRAPAASTLGAGPAFAAPAPGPLGAGR